MLQRIFISLIGIIISPFVFSQATITLRKSFIDSFKNKISISSDYMVFYSHPHANDEDGDIHFSGYDKKIGLPAVAEIMNGDDEHEALDTILAYEGKGKPKHTIQITGVWRLWAEHIRNGDKYSQGMGYKSVTSTGPDHVFEIHPVLTVKDLDLVGSLREIELEGFQEIEPQKAFKHYISRECTLTSNVKKINIQTGGAKFNYSQFWIRLLTTEKFKVDDGLFVYCDVYDSKSNAENAAMPKRLAHFIRMAFPKGSEAFEAVKDLNENDILHVVGIPRISLVDISSRVKQKKDLTKPLPVEMIVVGLK